MSDKTEADGALNALSAHEVLHTGSIISAMFDEYVAGHDYTRSDPELAHAADRLSEMLASFYQLVGSKSL